MDRDDVNFHFRFDGNDSYVNGFERESLHEGIEEESDDGGQRYSFDDGMDGEGNGDDLNPELEISGSYIQEEEGRSNIGYCPLDEILLDKTVCDISDGDLKAVEFESVEDAERFYKKYAWLLGFGVRRDMWVCNSDGVVVKRRWLCRQAGLRLKKHIEKEGRCREHQPLTRVNCKAFFRIRLCMKKGRYVVSGVNVEHNHDFVNSYHRHLIRSHRSVPDMQLKVLLHCVESE